MKRSSLTVLLLVSLLACPAIAQVQHVVPTDRVTTPAGGNFRGPLADAERTYQLLIHESELTNLVGLPLTALTWRLAGSSTTSWPAADATAADFDIFLSRSVDPALRSLTFADNVVGPQTQVRNGALTIPAGSFPITGTPREFGIDIQFDTPYLYTGDHLLIELRKTAFDVPPPGGIVDAILATTPGTGYGTRFSAAWEDSATATTGRAANFSVTRLTAIPEPGTLMTGVAGLMLLALRRRRCVGAFGSTYRS
jgi:hypothetical protein